MGDPGRLETEMVRVRVRVRVGAAVIGRDQLFRPLHGCTELLVAGRGRI